MRNSGWLHRIVLILLVCSWFPGLCHGSSWQLIDRSTGLPGDQVFAFSVFQNRMAVGTEMGAAIYSSDDYTWKAVRLPEQVASVPVRDLAFDANGNLWGATPRGVFHVQGDRCEVFGVEDGLPTVDAERLQVKGPNLFVGSFGGFVSRAQIPDNGRVSFTPVNYDRKSGENPHLKAIGISGLAMDSAAEGWYSTRGSGLIHCQGMALLPLDRSTGLTSDWVEAFWRFPGPADGVHMLVAALDGITMFRDGEMVGQVEIPVVAGDSWITSVVSVFSDSYQEPPRKGENADWTLPAFLGRRSLWIGTRNDGILRFENGEWKQYSPANSILPSKQIHRLYFHAGRVFACMSGGLAIIPLAAHSFDEFKYFGLGTKNFKTLYPNLVMSEIRHMEKTSDFWVVTDKGLCRFVGVSGLSQSILEVASDLSASYESEAVGSDTFGRPVTRTGELQWQHFYQDNGTLYHNDVTAFAGDPFSAVWMIFTGKTFARLRIKQLPPGPDEQEERKEQLTWDFFRGSTFPWPDGSILTCLWFHEGQLYVGTKDNGFFILENPGVAPDENNDIPLTWKHFSRVDGLTDEQILGFAHWRRTADEAGIVLLHKDGFSVWDGKNFGYHRPFSKREYFCLAADHQGNLWLGSDAGLVWIRSDFSVREFTTTTAHFESDRIRALAVAPDQPAGGTCALWVSCVQTLAESDVQPNVVDGKVYETDIDGASLHYFDGMIWEKWKVPGVRCLLLDGNYLFMGTNLRMRRFFIPTFLGK